MTEQVPGAGLVTGDLMDPARCRGNITAQTGLTASLYCCLGTENKDLGVGDVMIKRFLQNLMQVSNRFDTLTVL